jgi:hypothetical protein
VTTNPCASGAPRGAAGAARAREPQVQARGRSAVVYRLWRRHRARAAPRQPHGRAEGWATVPRQRRAQRRALAAAEPSHRTGRGCCSGAYGGRGGRWWRPFLVPSVVPAGAARLPGRAAAPLRNDRPALLLPGRRWRIGGGRVTAPVRPRHRAGASAAARVPGAGRRGHSGGGSSRRRR